MTGEKMKGCNKEQILLYISRFIDIKNREGKRSFSFNVNINDGLMSSINVEGYKKNYIPKQLKNSHLKDIDV